MFLFQDVATWRYAYGFREIFENWKFFFFKGYQVIIAFGCWLLGTVIERQVRLRFVVCLLRMTG